MSNLFWLIIGAVNFFIGIIIFWNNIKRVYKDIIKFIKSLWKFYKRKKITEKYPILHAYNGDVITVEKFLSFDAITDTKEQLRKKYECIKNLSPFKGNIAFGKPLDVYVVGILFSEALKMTDARMNALLEFIEDKFSDNPRQYFHNYHLIETLNKGWDRKAFLRSETIWIYLTRFGVK